MGECKMTWASERLPWRVYEYDSTRKFFRHIGPRGLLYINYVFKIFACTTSTS